MPLPSGIDRYSAPLHVPKLKESSPERDWKKIAGIVVAAIGALFLGLAYLAYTGSLPAEIVGGYVGIAFFAILGLLITAPAAYYVWKRW